LNPLFTGSFVYFQRRIKTKREKTDDGVDEKGGGSPKRRKWVLILFLLYRIKRDLGGNL
jgi:hypothetical protein